MKKIRKALVERTTEDLIHIGDVAEKFYNGDGGELLRAFINGRQSEQIISYQHEKTPLPSDLKMGRIEGLQMILDDFEQAIQVKNNLVAQRKDENSIS